MWRISQGKTIKYRNRSNIEQISKNKSLELGTLLAWILVLIRLWFDFQKYEDYLVLPIFSFRKYSICTVYIFDFMFAQHFPVRLYSVHATGSKAGLYFLYSFVNQVLEHNGVIECVICLISINPYICSLI